MIVEFNEKNFKKEVVESDLPVLVEFSASWCHPCRMIAPIVEEIAKEYEGRLKVGEVNIDEVRSLAIEYGVMNIPTLAILKGGKLVERIVGVASKEMIQSKIDPHL